MSLHVAAQRVPPGQQVIGPGQTANGWKLYNPEQSLYAETFTTPQVAHANHLRNTTPDNGRWMEWYYRLVHDTPHAGAHGYGGWAIIHRYRYTSDKGLGFKVHFCHRANFWNYLLQVQQSGFVTIWKEDRKGEGGYGRVIGKMPHSVATGQPFEWWVEVDGKGGICARVDGSELKVHDDDPITSGTVGYRLDRTDCSWGADGVMS